MFQKSGWTMRFKFATIIKLLGSFCVLACLWKISRPRDGKPFQPPDHDHDEPTELRLDSVEVSDACIELLNYDYPGNDINDFTVDSKNECKKSCEERSNCVGFSYVTRTNLCWLKSKLGKKRYDAGVVSGSCLKQGYQLFSESTDSVTSRTTAMPSSKTTLSLSSAGSANLAMHRSVIASSFYNKTESPARLVDGVYQSSYMDPWLGFHSENENNPWIQIDLGSSYHVAMVEIYNRMSPYEDARFRLFPFEVRIGDKVDGVQNPTCTPKPIDFKDRSLAPNPVVVYCAKSKGRYVMVRILKRTFLNICEVKVFEGKSYTGRSCRPPILDPFSSEMKIHFNPLRKQKCSAERDWIYVHSGKIYFHSDFFKAHPEGHCDVTPILRASEMQVKLGRALRNVENGTEIPSDSFFAHCVDRNSQRFKSIFASVKRDEMKVAAWKKAWMNAKGLPKRGPDARPPDIVMIGLDSMAHNAWKRYLPQAYGVLIKKLGAVPLNGYNIVGDGTPQALLPMLTGMTERELPEARRGRIAAKPVDDHPWIWRNFSQRGYATAFVEDGPEMGAFNYRMHGFKEQPTDVYGRTHFMAEKKFKDFFISKTHHCVAGLHRYTSGFINLIREHFRVLPEVPKFLFMFSGDFTHGSNDVVASLDDDLRDFFLELKAERRLENAVLVVFADHGARFSKMRQTEQGKIEERMPLYAIRFPDWFRQMYPKKFESFVKNAEDALVTPFDVYATFRHILQIDQDKMEIPHFKSHRGVRGISLFQPISTERLCSDADIEPHWCACLRWKPMHTRNTLVLHAASNFVNFLNGLTEAHRSKCALLRLGKILSAGKFETDRKMRKFVKTKDGDGFEPDLSGNTKQTIVTVQIKVETLPGHGLFECTLKVENGIVTVNSNEISRINQYGNQPACVAADHPYLRRFCYCLDQSLNETSSSML